jgi:glutamate formiminotransferase / formiminotetrahydrofolate cyclodeaminase
MRQLVECVPNFSEGRDAAKIDAIVRAIESVPGVFLLDRSSDPDHNRTVITMAGEPEAVLEAALRAVGKAAEVIDLRKHTGAHPRIGATDVLPFVPISGITLADCVLLARKAGREIWERYRIPVYYYEAAARRPERVNLETLRKGRFEGLRKEVMHDPDRSPDVGDPRLHPTAGATVVGARKFLVAYNINLNTADLEIAKRIAKAVRYSSGGLRYVKAMAVDLRARGLAQVSMNLTDFEQTPVHRVFEMVKSEAARHGVSIAGSEVVGLIPRSALGAAAGFYLQLENFSATQVFENCLQSAENEVSAHTTAQSVSKPQLISASSNRFAATGLELAPAPASAGGSVAALAVALSETLAKLSAGLSANAGQLESFASCFQAVSTGLAGAVDRDAAAFSSVMAAHDLPHTKIAQRERAIQQSLERTAEIPLQVARAAVEIFEGLGQLEALLSPPMLSDVRAGRATAAAAARGALENVAIHLESIADGPFSAKARAESQSLAARITESSVTAGR